MASRRTTRSISRRQLLLAALAGSGAAVIGVVASMRRSLARRLSAWMELPEFNATPPLVPHDPVRDARVLHVARGGEPAANVDSLLSGMGGIERVVGEDDLVLIKVSAQWWNQGMTNVAAVKRVIEKILERPGFRGEIVVFENVHFRLKDGSGLARAFTHRSERNVDVDGWDKMGDLIPHFARLGAPVSVVGLIDAGPSALADDLWHDPGHEHGVYGGDGRGPIGEGEVRDGYRWDLDDAFRLRRTRLAWAQTPLTWPVFRSPHSGLLVDLRDGVFRVDDGRRTPVQKKLTWISMTTVNQHGASGLTCCCKSAMGLVDMSAGRLGTDARVRKYSSVHYFGYPNASWRMAGPLATFARKVRAPDLYIAVAQWVGVAPPGAWDSEQRDIRLAAVSAHPLRTIVAGTDPVAIDTWCARHLLMPLAAGRDVPFDVGNPDSTASRFLRYYRQVYGSGTLDESLISVA